MDYIVNEICDEKNNIGNGIFPAGYENGLLSTEVAELLGKRHNDLLRDIKKYTEYLTDQNQEKDLRNFASIFSLQDTNILQNDVSDFWKESTYQDEYGRSQPCYLVTKMGCEFIAHKLSGKKGAIFTCRYIRYFHKMEHLLEAQRSHMKDVQRDISQVKQKSPSRLTAVRPPKHLRWEERNRNKIRALKGAAFLRQETFWAELTRKIDEEFGIVYLYGRMGRETGCARMTTQMLIDYFPEVEKFADEYLARYYECKAISDYYEKHYGHLDN